MNLGGKMNGIKEVGEKRGIKVKKIKIKVKVKVKRVKSKLV